MNKIIERAKRLQALLGDIAEHVAQNTNFIQRRRKVTAMSWLLATVFDDGGKTIERLPHIDGTDSNVNGTRRCYWRALLNKYFQC